MTCTITYAYTAKTTQTLRDGTRADATATIDGHTQVIATGRVIAHRLKLTFRHLKPGRYRFRLWELHDHHRTALGCSSIAIS